MGVLNVTPDSFSDGGRYFGHEEAIAKGLQMLAEGADLVDVGGESTRPGADPVPESEEMRRVIPVVEALAPRIRVSVDTTKASVAQAAVDAGATLINDTSATLWLVAAARGVGWIAMHMRGNPRTMQQHVDYEDVVGEVHGFLVERARRATDAGVEEVWVDPGIGFAKTPEQNLVLLRRVSDLVSSGFPVVLGTSRKSFLGRLAAKEGADPAPVSERLEGSLATAVWGMLSGVSMVRAHDVAATVQVASLVGDTRIAQTLEEVGAR
jgi:dihydropteroate synthase